MKKVFKKNACWACGSLAVVGWGKQQGKQRLNAILWDDIYAQQSIRCIQQSIIWFEKWIIERQVYKYLVPDSGLSQISVQRLFRHYLKQAPEVAIKS